MTHDSLIYIIGTGVCGSLTGAVVFLFHRFEHAKQQLVTHFESQLLIVNARLKDCEDDRNALRNQMVAIHGELIEVRQKLA